MTTIKLSFEGDREDFEHLLQRPYAEAVLVRQMLLQAEQVNHYRRQEPSHIAIEEILSGLPPAPQHLLPASHSPIVQPTSQPTPVYASQPFEHRSEPVPAPAYGGTVATTAPAVSIMPDAVWPASEPLTVRPRSQNRFASAMQTIAPVVRWGWKRSPLLLVMAALIAGAAASANRNHMQLLQLGGMTEPVPSPSPTPSASPASQVRPTSVGYPPTVVEELERRFNQPVAP